MAEAREQAVAQRAAKHRAKARRGAEIAQVINGHRVVPPPLERFVEPLRGDARVRRFGADAARERVELFHRLEVIAVKADSLHHHQRLAVGRLDTLRLYRSRHFSSSKFKKPLQKILSTKAFQSLKFDNYLLTLFFA